MNSKVVLAMALLLAALALSMVEGREISETTAEVKPDESSFEKESLYHGSGWGGYGGGWGGPRYGGGRGGYGRGWGGPRYGGGWGGPRYGGGWGGPRYGGGWGGGRGGYGGGWGGYRHGGYADEEAAAKP